MFKSIFAFCFWLLLHCCVFSLHSTRVLCILVLLASLRQSSSFCTHMPMWFLSVLVGLPLSSPQNKHLISLHTCRTISPTQSHTLQSSLEQSIILDALAQREKTATKQLDIGTFPANCLFNRLFSLHKTFSSLPFLLRRWSLFAM